MGDSEKLIELAERCENAEGPDRELDIAILTHPAIGYRDVHGDGAMFDRGTDGYWFVDDCSIHQLPSPTASLDAALSLAPKDYEWQLEAEEAEMVWPALSPWTYRCQMGHLIEVQAITPALALCAAALRARAALGEIERLAKERAGEPLPPGKACRLGLWERAQRRMETAALDTLTRKLP